MADKKISALTAATTPLAGTEVLPIVQSASTVKVAVNDMLGVTSWTSPAVNSEGNMFLRATDTLATDVGTQIGLGGKYNATSYFPFAAVAGRKENATNNNVAGYLSFLTTTSGGTLTERARIDSTGNLVISTAGKGIDFSANANAPGMTSELLNWYEQGTWTPSDGSGAGLGLTVANATYTRIGRLVTANFAITYPATANATNARIGGLPFTSSSVGFSFPMVVSFSQTGICKTGLVDTSATTFLLSDTAGNALTNAQMSTLILRGTVIYEV